MSQITEQPARERIERFVERAEEIYRNQLAAKLEPAYAGKIAAIDPDTGGYTVGEYD
jgi:hypothetical protein